MGSWKKFEQELLSEPRVKEEYDKLMPVEIAAQLIRARRKRGLNQAELAKLAKTTQSAISRLESGRYRGYSLLGLQKIASVLDHKIEIVIKPLRKKAA